MNTAEAIKAIHEEQERLVKVIETAGYKVWQPLGDVQIVKENHSRLRFRLVVTRDYDASSDGVENTQMMPPQSAQ